MRFVETRREIHSERRADSGSDFVARKAGIEEAAKATKASNSPAPRNIPGSLEFTPYRRLSSARVRANRVGSKSSADA